MWKNDSLCASGIAAAAILPSVLPKAAAPSDPASKWRRRMSMELLRSVEE
jgi:hypothetical protein